MNESVGTPVRIRAWLGALLAILLVGSGLVATPAFAEEPAPASEEAIVVPEAAPSEIVTPDAAADAEPAVETFATSPVIEPEPELRLPSAAPELTVSKTNGLNPLGETITVTGQNITTGFANTHGIGEAGVYAQIGYLDSEWRPSAGAGSTARSNAYSVWVKETAPSASYLAWTDNGDGTADFSWTVTIDHATLATKSRAGATLAVFMLGGGGVVQAANELAVPITFTVPTVNVSKTANLDSAGETVTVTGSGFLPNPPMTSGARPPLAGKFTGAYVGFGRFADVWKPTEGAPGSARKLGDHKWLVHESELAIIGGAASGGAVVAPDGTFTVELLVKKGIADEPEIGNYGIYTYAGGGAKYAPFETYTPITFAPQPTDLTFTSSPSGSVTEGGLVTLSAQLASPIPGVVEFANGSVSLGTVTPSAAGVATLGVPSLPVGAHTLTATFIPTDGSRYASSTASISYSVVAKPVIAAGSLTWGVKQSFRSYVTSSIAKGTISVNGVGTSGGSFVFGQASGGSFNGSTGTSNYSGSVRFTGHDGVLDLRLSNPVVRVDSATSGTLMVGVNGSTVPFATLALASATKRVTDGAVSYSNVPATLTSQGAGAFVNGDAQFYPAGTTLDPVSFVIGAPSSSGAGAYTAAAFVAAAAAIPPTPPATTGITLETDPARIVEGGEVTVTADGFQPNETGIKVVIYSEPVTLATDAQADSHGVVTWTGRLPSGLTGQHTLTFQGSVDRGIVLDIQANLTTSALGCLVDQAELSWGFHAPLRSYISGAIANGQWTVADGATYETPSFGWSDGEGNYDAENGDGLLTFAGSVQFTGHSGVLNTTVANPQIRFDDAATATLLLDVIGTTQQGEEVSQQGVEFATIDLSAAEVSEDGYIRTFANAPTVLTPAGSAAFGTYVAGTELDPITVSFSDSSGCAVPVTESPAVNTSDERDAGPGPWWLVWMVGALLVMSAAVTVWIVIRRRSVA